MKSNLFLLLLIVTSCQSQPNENQQPKDYNANQVVDDIRFLKSELDRFHPGLNRYTSKSQMDQYFVEAALAKYGLDADELYGRITFLLSQVKCGHTRTAMTEQQRDKHMVENKFVPFHIQMLGTEAYVSASLADEVPVGARVSKINGQTWKEIERAIFDHLPADGTIVTGKRRMISNLFPYYYQLFIDTSDEDVEVELVLENNQVEKIAVTLVSNLELKGVLNSRQRKTELTINHFDHYSNMRISTFGKQRLNNAGLDYESFLRTSFKEIKSKGVDNLILDLRGNGGGQDNYGALLVSYLLPQEFGYFDNIQVTPHYSGYGGVVERNGKQFVTRHQGLNRWEPQEHVYDGDLFVLIDGGSFSTCADVATVIHHHRRAVFVGEETGGGYDGNTSGNSKSITLPNSGIIVYVPMWKYTTANIGHQFPGRGVIPDFEVIHSWKEYASEKDVMMEKVLELIKN